MLKKAIVGIIVGSIVLMSSAGAIYAYQKPKNVEGSSQPYNYSEKFNNNDGTGCGNYCNDQCLDENNDGKCDNCDQVNCQNNGTCSQADGTCSQNNENCTYQNQNQNQNQNSFGISSDKGNSNCFMFRSEENNQSSVRNCSNNKVPNGKNK